MASLKQADRLMQFTSPAGKDVLLIESIEGSEGISRLFEYSVDLLATVDTTIDVKSLIGAKVTVAISLNDAQGSRYVNGIVASFEQRAGDAEFNVYRARIVPSMWQLTLGLELQGLPEQDGSGYRQGSDRHVWLVDLGPDGWKLPAA